MPKNNNENDIVKFFDILKENLKNKELIKLTLSNKKSKSDLKNILANIINIKSQYRLNVIYRYQTKDITKNYTFDEGINILHSNFDAHFFNADLFCITENYFLKTKKDGKILLKKMNSTTGIKPNFEHNKNKKTLIEAVNNIYLRETGITNAQGEVRKDMYYKYRQINKYIELLTPALINTNHTNALHIADMGSGKGYLTFALYDYLTNTLKKTVKITGIENNDSLVKFCNEVALKSGFKNLSFTQGSIQKTPINDFDILIALHACDTATDEAIYRGIKAQASLIVCAPCCHKQIRNEININNPLNPIFKHGIFAERQAEMITDTLRAMYLEAYGYKTKIIEFIETEHTPKNILIIAQKSKTKANFKKITNEIKELKNFFGIKYFMLEKLLFD